MYTEYPAIAITVVFAVIGIFFPIFTPRGPNQGVTRCSIILTAFVCWAFWGCCYLAQRNPLVGPSLTQSVALTMAREWGNKL